MDLRGRYATFCFRILQAVHAIEVLRFAGTAGGDRFRRPPEGAGANGRRSGLGIMEVITKGKESEAALDDTKGM